MPSMRDEVVERVVRPVLGFSVNQEAAISVCEARKDAAVAVIDAHNTIATEVAKPQRPWWKLWGR